MKNIGAFEFHEETEFEKLFNSIRKYLSRYERDNTREDMIYHSLVDLLMDDDRHYLWDMIVDEVGGFIFLRDLAKKLQKEVDFIYGANKKKIHFKENSIFMKWDETQTKRFGKVLYRVSIKPEGYVALKLNNDGFFMKLNEFEELCSSVDLVLEDFNETQFSQLWAELFVNDEKVINRYKRKYRSLKLFNESYEVENGIDIYEKKESSTREFKLGDKEVKQKREMDKQIKKDDLIIFGGGVETQIDIDTKLLNQDRYGNN